MRTALVGLVAGAAALCASTGALAAQGGSDAARDAFVKGDLAHASSLADAAHDGWIGGLAAFKQKNFADALARFGAVASDATQTDARRAAAGYWASRAAEKAGDASQGDAFLKTAAAFPHTFYGMIAARRIALATGVESARQAALSLAALPKPELAPAGGFTIAKALVYAIVLKESRFNTNAHGGAAWGLMQLTPGTAASVSGDRRFASNPQRLHDASTNLQVGQTYVAKLLALAKGDLLRGLAAYNVGPAALVRASSDGDSLMALESLPGAAAREYVQKVMTAYWSYRQAFGKTSSPTLDAAASGGKIVLASLDD
ncbi:MAG: transglycosylase SLT domain-containing protein [Caulobacteraceae bacterium]|nr:transglycosylase SLT domain-containing protein [Caulobacter sp.]